LGAIYIAYRYLETVDGAAEREVGEAQEQAKRAAGRKGFLEAMRTLCGMRQVILAAT
jgi:hypothetical protein